MWEHAMWEHVLTQVVMAVPNPPPLEPPGLGKVADTVIGWAKWGVTAAGVVGLLAAAFMIMIGRRNRNAMASEGVAGAAWVLAGLALASTAAGLVSVFVL
jgi:hypothetical protein